MIKIYWREIVYWIVVEWCIWGLSVILFLRATLRSVNERNKSSGSVRGFIIGMKWWWSHHLAGCSDLVKGRRRLESTLKRNPITIYLLPFFPSERSEGARHEHKTLKHELMSWKFIKLNNKHVNKGVNYKRNYNEREDGMGFFFWGEEN